MNIDFDEQYLVSVTTYKEWSMYANKTELTEEEMIKVLKGEDKCSMTGTIDHPEFTKLRERLEQEGYIRVECGWWNGDTVLKPFTFNGFKMKKGRKFPCAPALGNSIACARQYGWKDLV